MTNSYDKPSLVRISAEFTNGTVDLAVSAVTCRYRNQSGTAVVLVYGVDAALIQSATGKYYVDILASQQGYYYYRFETTGSFIAATEGSFFVKPSQF